MKMMIFVMKIVMMKVVNMIKKQANTMAFIQNIPLLGTCTWRKKGPKQTGRGRPPHTGNAHKIKKNGCHLLP